MDFLIPIFIGYFISSFYMLAISLFLNKEFQQAFPFKITYNWQLGLIHLAWMLFWPPIFLVWLIFWASQKTEET